jgi:hypothetical protein
MASELNTFSLIVSSTGVLEAMVENGLLALVRPRANRRNMGLVKVVRRRADLQVSKKFRF